jgi:hypothetical protein
MATEISEVFFAAAMLDSVTTVKASLKDEKTLREYYKVVVNHVKSTIVFPDEAKRKEYLSLIKIEPEKNDKSIRDNNLKILINMVQGMSAALGFRQELGSVGKKTPRVFLTGNKWPKEIDIFRVEIDNWKDYNSTDVMITFNNKMYYGVSLKKKSNPQAGDPTLVNKSFETMIESRTFDGVREQLIDAKKKYLTDIVIDAVNAKVIDPRDINKASTTKCKSLTDFNAWAKTPIGRKELLESKMMDKKLFMKPGKAGSGSKYINVKGWPGNYWNVSKGDMKKSGSMRYFVNKQLADRENGLFAEYIKIMNSQASIFGEALLSIILKTKLEDVLHGKGSPILGKYEFGFYLATGIGTINTKGDISYSVGEVKSLKTVLCGLTRIKKKKLKDPYQITLRKKLLKKKEEEGDEVESEATKVYLSLKSGTTEILDLELRFKGDFMSSPQFQATINSSFNQLLHNECSN